eukprot:gene3533-13600_t
MHEELVAMVSLSSLLSERSQVMQVWEHGLESSDSLWEAWHTMWRNLSFPPGISDCPLKRMDVLRELQGCFVQRFLHCMAYELLALCGAETKAANRVALHEKSGPTQGSKKGYNKRKGDKLEGCGEKRKLPDAERVQPPDAHATGPQDAEHLAPDVVTAPQPKKSKLSDRGLTMLSCFGLNKKSSMAAYPPQVGHCEDLPSPPPIMLLSTTPSDLNLSFSALSPTNKVDLSPYSEIDLEFDFKLEGRRVQAPVSSDDDSSALSELWPFSEKEGDNLNISNLNGIVALSGVVAFNGDNLEGTSVRSGMVGCTDHVSEPLGTKGHRHVSRRFPSSVLDTRVCSQRVVQEDGVLCCTASHNSTLADEQCRHGTPSLMQKLFPAELQEKFKRKVFHTTKRLDPDHQKLTAVQTMARSAAKGHQRQCLAQRCLIPVSLDISKYQQRHVPSPMLTSPAGEPSLAPHGSHMAPHGSHMAPHGSHMAPHGSHMAPHGPYMAPHGSHMAPHGSHMPPHGSHMPPHGSWFRAHDSQKDRTWPTEAYNSLPRLHATESCSSSTNSTFTLVKIIHEHPWTAQGTPPRQARLVSSKRSVA